jgi:hypothetical protein
MEETRRADHTPRFGMQVVFIGERWSGIRITQVGPGAAIDADLRLKFIPFPHISDRPVTKAFRLGVAEKGRRVHVEAPCEHDSLKEFCTTYQRVELEGTMKDALGNVHQVSEVMDELQSFANPPNHGVEYAEPSELVVAIRRVASEMSSLKWYLVESNGYGAEDEGEDDEGDDEPTVDLPDDVPF